MSKLLMGRLYLFLIIIIFSGRAQTQGLSDTDTLCLGEQISLAIPPDFGNSVQWDFCEGRFLNKPHEGLLATNVAALAREIRMIREGGTNYAIIVTNNSQLSVIRFNEELTAINQFVNHGNLSGYLSAPWGMDLVKEADTWLAFVGNYNGSGQIVRLKFTNGLMQLPEADTLAGLGLPTVRNTGIAILPDLNGSKRLLVSSITGAFYMIDFGDSYLNNPNENQYVASPGVVNSFGIRVGEFQGQYFGVLTSTTGQFYRLRFNENQNVSYELIANVLPAGIGTVKPLLVLDRGRLNVLSPYYNSTNFLNLELRLTNYSAEKLYQFTDLGISTRQSAFDGIQLGNKYIGLSLDYSTGALYRYEFASDCNADILSSMETAPVIEAVDAGKIYFSVTDQTTGLYQADSVWVLHPLEPDFTSNYNCFGAATEFYNTTLTQGTKIKNVFWDFDDGGATSIDLNPTHAFSSAGEYQVSLTTTDECDQQVVFQKMVTIYPEDDAEPAYSIVNPLKCSFDSLQFSDNSTFDNDSIVGWLWQFGDGHESSLQHPKHAYLANGTYSVSLTIQLKSGCERNITNDETIISGTSLDFNFYKNCEGDSVEFTDASIQAFPNTEVSRLWNFGDAASGPDNTSTLISPKHVFSAVGIYQVRLDVENSLGCVNSIIKTVEVFDNPTIIIDDKKALSHRPFQFRIDEVLTDDPVLEYQWDFGDNGAGSVEKEPFHTYNEESTFQASVYIKTLSGCESIQDFSIETFLGDAEVDFPILEYEATDTIDALESIDIINSSSNYIDWSWDFDEGDLRDSAQITAIPLAASTLFRQIRDLQLIKEAGIWYALAVTNDSKLRVFKFENGLKNAPTIFDYGNPSNLLLNAWGIDVIQENGKWRGLVANFGVSMGLVYFSFENGLEQAPIAQKINHTFTSLRLSNVKIERFKGDLYAFVLGNVGRLEILNFGGKLHDGLQEGAASYSLTIASAAYSFDIMVNKDQVFGAFILTNGKHFIFKLNSSFQFVSPVQEITSTLGGINSLGAGVVTWDAGEMVHIFSEYNTGRIHRINIPEDLLLAKVKHKVLNPTTGISTFATIELVKEGSQWQGLGLNFSTGALFNVEFGTGHDIVPETSSEFEPNITFNEPGTFYFTLKAVDHLGHTAYLTDSIRVRRPPIVNFDVEYTCTYFDTFFNADIQTDGTEVASYLWEFGDDSTSEESAPIYRYPDPGTYMVKLTVVDSRGATGVFSKEIKIFPEDAFAVDFSFDEVVCANSAVQFVDESSSLEEQIGTYSWDFGDDFSSEANSSNLASPTHIYQQPGFYDVVLTVTGESGCPVFVTKEVEVDYAPEIDFEATSTCLGQITSFNVSEEPSSAIAFNWDFADGFTSDAINPEHSFSASAFYNVALTVDYDNGCAYTVEKPVFVPPLPNMDFNYEIPCQGTAINFTDLTSSEFAQIVERRWSFDDGTSTIITTESMVNHNFTLPGNYDVKLEVLTNDGCANKITKVVQILETANLDFSWNGTCEDRAITFTDLTQVGNAGQVLNRTWRIEGITYNSTQVIHTFSEAGDYPIILEITTQNGCLKTLSKNIHISALPQPDFLVVQSCVGQEIILENNTISEDAIEQIIWKLVGSDQVVQEQEIAGFDIALPGFYDIELDVTTISGCNVKRVKTIQVYAPPVAGFIASPEFGAPPLNVTFTNTSTNAVNYQWQFLLGEGSVEASPAYEFTQNGNYNVKLMAYNSVGCVDLAEKTIRIVDPALDIAVNSLQAVEEGGTIRIVVNLTNKGTVTMNNCDFEIRLNNGIKVNESFSGSLNPNQSQNYTLKFEIKKEEQNALNLICVKANWSVEDLVDGNANNNEACLLLNEEARLLAPYPNPAQDELTIPLVLPSKDVVELTIQDVQGHQIYQEGISTASAGLNALIIDTSHYANGIYFIRVKFQNQYYSSKFVIAR